jgi:hypothetical protein
MAYKRTTKKTGKNSRSTTTLNTNGTNTQSSSFNSGKGTTRTTSSTNSKTGSKVTQTLVDGNGYVHKKTIFSTAKTARENRQRQKQAAEFGKALGKLFGGNKKPSPSRTAKPIAATNTKPTTPRNKSGESSSLGNLIILGLLLWGAYAIFT